MSKSPLKIFIITLACIFPSLLTFVYFVWLADNSAGWQQAAYSLGKLIQFTLPVWATVWIFKKTIKIPLHFSKNIWKGILFGLAVVILMFLLLHSPVLSHENLRVLQSTLQLKIDSIGINSLNKFIFLGIFYGLLHSFLEEYYWRWFIYGNLRKLMRPNHANLTSSVAFSAHHLILLWVLFAGEPICLPLTLAIALGGGFWAWQYEKTNSILSSWLSHLMVDAGIFLVGYQLVQLS